MACGYHLLQELVSTRISRQGRKRMYEAWNDYYLLLAFSYVSSRTIVRTGRGFKATQLWLLPANMSVLQYG